MYKKKKMFSFSISDTALKILQRNNENTYERCLCPCLSMSCNIASFKE